MLHTNCIKQMLQVVFINRLIYTNKL